MISGKNDRCSDEHNAGDNGASTRSPQHDSGSSGAKVKGDWLDVRQFDWRACVNQRPYATLAAALGIGYVLGGGLFSRPTARILGLVVRLAARIVAVPVIGNRLLDLAEGGAPGTTP